MSAAIASDHYPGPGLRVLNHPPAPEQLALEFGPAGTALDVAFAAWRKAHPEALAELVDMARRWRGAGRNRWSVNGVFEAVRWERQIAGLPAPDSPWKLNNSLRSRVARAILDEHPDLAGLFELRELRS